MRLFLLLFFAMFGMAYSASGAEARSQRMSASLVADTLRPKPGSTITLGLRFQPRTGWHGYWSNPGESGIAPQVEWSAPGLTFGPLQHPAPTILRVAGITSHVHAGEHVLLSRVRIPALAPGTKLPITAQVSWLVCSETLCVPERASMEMQLVVGDGTPSAESALLRNAAARLPKPIATEGSFVRVDDQLRFTLPSGLSNARARFFPDANGFMDSSTVRTSAKGQLVAAATGRPPKAIDGVLSDGRSAYRLRFVEAGPAGAAGQKPGEDAASDAGPGQALAPGAPARQATDRGATTAAVRSVAAPASAGKASSESGAPDEEGPFAVLLLAFGGAVLGGLLLNLMPCVFPILSLKALHLAKAGTTPGEVRGDALGYAAGAVLGCLALGAVMLGLKHAGAEIGWSFQLQSPIVILALLLLVTAVALNLAGLFEVRGPSVSGAHGAFASGVLAAVIATPCSGPFMATALGASLVLPAPAALLVFAGLGLGLALPYLVLAFVPAARSRLPRPGSWMDTLRKALAVPMMITAVGLLWLLGRQAGPDAMSSAILLSVLLGLSLWWLGLRQQRGAARSALILAPIALAIGLVMTFAPPRSVAVASAPSDAQTFRFSETRLAELRRQQRPVFVDFTADWCLTCKVNEKVAIDREDTREAFRRAGIVTLEGDWTRGDPAITRFLAAHGRNSIPFYLYYAPGQEAEVLPQLLTPTMLQELASPGRARGDG